jgi:glutaminyl-peptide cyclotransferase
VGRKKRKKQTGRTSPTSTGRGTSRVWIVALVLVVVAVVGVFQASRSVPPSAAAPTAVPSSRPASSVPPSATAVSAEPGVRTHQVDVLREFAHERDAYTQGLVWWNDQLFESTGRVGDSTLRRLDPQTGEVLQRIDIAQQYFGEGLALVDERLIMLTWRAERAFTFDRESFEALDTYRYRGEGWGLCLDGDRLIMSDGTDLLTFRDPVTFEPIGEQRVTLRGQSLSKLNELECVDGAVYANVWEDDFLVRIDPDRGTVTDVIDAAGLLQGDDLVGSEVLNGIAYNPDADTFYITGKWWPKMFEVRFVPDEQ